MIAYIFEKHSANFFVPGAIRGLQFLSFFLIIVFALASYFFLLSKDDQLIIIIMDEILSTRIFFEIFVCFFRYKSHTQEANKRCSNTRFFISTPFHRSFHHGPSNVSPSPPPSSLPFNPRLNIVYQKFHWTWFIAETGTNNSTVGNLRSRTRKTNSAFFSPLSFSLFLSFSLLSLIER